MINGIVPFHYYLYDSYFVRSFLYFSSNSLYFCSMFPLLYSNSSQSLLFCSSFVFSSLFESSILFIFILIWASLSLNYFTSVFSEYADFFHFSIVSFTNIWFYRICFSNYLILSSLSFISLVIEYCFLAEWDNWRLMYFSEIFYSNFACLALNCEWVCMPVLLRCFIIVFYGVLSCFLEDCL